MSKRLEELFKSGMDNIDLSDIKLFDATSYKETSLSTAVKSVISDYHNTDDFFVKHINACSDINIFELPTDTISNRSGDISYITEYIIHNDSESSIKVSVGRVDFILESMDMFRFHGKHTFVYTLIEQKIPNVSAYDIAIYKNSSIVPVYTSGASYNKDRPGYQISSLRYEM